MNNAHKAQASHELACWLTTPAGRYLLEWEMQRLDQAVADVFGFHAVQLGLPQVDGLRANRMPHRWLAQGDGARVDNGAALRAADLHCHFDALPFASHSVDLIVLPHTLELTHDPHRTLAEVERVLVPEGRVVILGFNPTSLWALRQRFGRIRRRFGGRRTLFMPEAGEFIGYWRLRDWLRLLSFEIEGGRFGCYRPPMRSQRWFERFEWMDPAGAHWWPVFGAVYFLTAVKRVRGMRLVGLARERAKPKAAPAVIANRHRETITE